MAAVDNSNGGVPWRPAWASVVAIVSAVGVLPVLYYGARIVLSELGQPSGGWLRGVGYLLGGPLVLVSGFVIVAMIVFLLRGGRTAFTLGAIAASICLYGIVLALTGWL